MAIFNKINKHSKVVGIVIGAGLLLFILGNEFFGPNSLFGRKKNEVGEIAGNTISYEEYAQQLAITENDYMVRTGKSVTETDRPSIQEQAWTELVMKYAYKPQYDKLGLVVTDEETVDMVQGKNIHPTVKQLFTNPQTQQFDKGFVVDFLSSLDKREARDQQLWASVEKSIRPERVQTKYMNLFKMSNYITREEAKREYAHQTDKAEAKFVYVAYYSIADSTVIVTDSEIEDYISKDKAKYEVQPGRSFDFVSFSINPSAKDSAAFKKELQDIAGEFRTTDNDSLFVLNNSDAPNPPKLVNIGELPEELKAYGKGLKFDSVYGPFAQGGKYVLFKVLGTRSDTVFSARASHILIRAEGSTPEAKESAKAKATQILTSIKSGASFEQMAMTNGTDGTASKGGDLGWFSQGQMVGKFNDAVFAATSPGLIPNLVETEFGYHIIKVTETKTNQKYELATVEREIVATEETKDIAFKQADTFAASVDDTADFNAAVKKDKSLIKQTGKNVKPSDRFVNGIPNPRELVRWAFTDARINSVSPVFTTDNSYVVAILTGKRDKGIATADDVRDEITVKIRNDKKADIIIKKLADSKGTLEQIGSKYGASAAVNTANDITFASNSITGIGYEPTILGVLFGLQKGKVSSPVKGESGVAILQMLNLTRAPEIADYTTYKTQLAQQRSGREEYGIDEVIRKEAKIEDERYRFF